MREESKDTGVGVTVLMPSVTDTNVLHRAEMDDIKAGADEARPSACNPGAFDVATVDGEVVS